MDDGDDAAGVRDGLDHWAIGQLGQTRIAAQFDLAGLGIGTIFEAQMKAGRKCFWRLDVLAIELDASIGVERHAEIGGAFFGRRQLGQFDIATAFDEAGGEDEKDNAVEGDVAEADQIDFRESRKTAWRNLHWPFSSYMIATSPPALRMACIKST